MEQTIQMVNYRLISLALTTEYCGKVEQYDYQLYLAINDIEHTKTKAMPSICEMVRNRLI
ncbi:TPA: hypothetical protein J1Y50_004302 [Escherichia coli]|nr:hypothetical protein [Escherichia coli]